MACLLARGRRSAWFGAALLAAPACDPVDAYADRPLVVAAAPAAAPPRPPGCAGLSTLGDCVGGPGCVPWGTAPCLGCSLERRFDRCTPAPPPPTPIAAAEPDPCARRKPRACARDRGCRLDGDTCVRRTCAELDEFPACDARADCQAVHAPSDCVGAGCQARVEFVHCRQRFAPGSERVAPAPGLLDLRGELAMRQATQPRRWTPPTLPAGAPTTREFLAGPNICRRAACEQDPRCCAGWPAGCDQVVMNAAFLNSDLSYQTGQCYYHGRASCPNCACPFYLKVRKLGHDGGTGCLAGPEAVYDALQAACAAQRCE